ncbi:MAG TPA: hypothetical protein VN721_14760 [Flavipsychrobacter sp.]|nr:hypothetical protein [Flavipsychrobacter sp.]
MAYYEITITCKDGNIKRGIREDNIDNIDQYYQKICYKALHTLKDKLQSCEVVMLPKDCKKVQDYIKRARQSRS